MFSNSDINSLVLTLKLAAISTSILLFFGTPLAWWLSRTQWKYKFIFEATFALPLVLPPSVLGFYLMIALGPHGIIGKTSTLLGGGPLAFTFTGLVIGSVIYSMPFVIQPLQNTFTSIQARHLEVAATLGASPIDRFLTITLPLARPGFLTATILGFAHTIGEFGVVLMIGGNIPGETQVLSIAIYDHVESLEYHQAHWLSGSLLVASFLLLVFVYAFNRHLSFFRT